MQQSLNTLIEHINKMYSFKPKVLILNKVTKGFLSENHIIGNNQVKYFLKKYRFDDEQKVKTIHQVKFHFAENNIPVILPLRTTEHKSFFEWQESFYALFPFVEGITIEENDSWTEKVIKSFAENLAAIHLAGKSHQIAFPSNQKVFNKEDSIRNIDIILQTIKQKKVKDDFDKTALKVLKRKKRLLIQTPKDSFIPKLKPDHLIHGDYQNQNVFFNKNQEISHIFDWEKTDIAPRIAEVLRAMEYTFMQDMYLKENIRNAIKFFYFYHQKYPLSNDEIEKGINEYAAKKIPSLWVETEHYLKNNKRVDQFLAPQIKSINFFTKEKDKFKKELLSQL